MLWSAEYAVHPLEIGSVIHWNLVYFSYLYLVTYGLPSAHRGLCSWKRAFSHASTKDNKVREMGILIHLNFLSPVCQDFLLPKKLSICCPLGQWIQTFPLSRPSFVVYISFASSMDS